MSYILEALKKSEQERNPNKVPDLSSQHEQIVMAPKKSFPWVWFVVILVILNLITFYWLYFNKPQEVQTDTNAPVIEQPKEESMPVVEENVDSEPVSSEPVSSEQPIDTPVVKAELKPQVQTVVIPPSAPAPLKYSDLPHISELAVSIQNQLPALSFSTHVYVSGGGGFVIINERNLSDGMTLGNGLVLEKIVPEGVILSFRDRVFTLRAMESWQTN